jgi:hypothetical protein
MENSSSSHSGMGFHHFLTRCFTNVSRTCHKSARTEQTGPGQPTTRPETNPHAHQNPNLHVEGALPVAGGRPLALGRYMHRNLTCPYCCSKTKMTLKSDWLSVRQHYLCAKCAKRTRLVTNPGWIQYTTWLVQLLPVASVYLWSNMYNIIAAVAAYVCIFVVTQKLEARYGVLERTS